MANPILALLFRQQQAQGWVSSYFLNSADLVTGLADAQALNTAEMGLLGATAECNRISVSQLGVKRDVNSGPAVTQFGQYPPPPQPAADGNICFTVQFTATDTVRAKHFLRGIPEGVVQVTPALTLNVGGAFKTAYDAWQTAVLAHVVLIQGKRTGPGPFTSFPVKFMTTVAATTNIPLSIRRVGRPFGLPRGRRAVGA